uniref:Uncharacterized protein n=1 Tax=Sinocyclocheilus rhinocerous TaxID=307959 RepID=A0A673M7U0_9TELE
MAESKSNQSCSVPLFSNLKKKQPYLSFHSFPTDENVRNRSTFVLTVKHFMEDEVRVHPESGRKYLTPQAVPSRFACILSDSEHINPS